MEFTKGLEELFSGNDDKEIINKMNLNSNKSKNGIDKLAINDESDSEMFYGEGKRGKSANDLKNHLFEICKFISISEELFIYQREHNYWIPIDTVDGENLIRQSMNDEHKKFASTYQIKEAIKWIKADLTILCVNKEELERREAYFNFKNGVFNIDTNEILDGETPELYFQTYIDMDVPNMDDKELLSNTYYEQYLKSTFDTKEQRKTFEEMLGLCISSVRNKKYAFFFFGPSNTGKSVALNLIKGIVGRKFAASVSFSQLGDDFAVSQLAGKYINLSGEMSGVASKRIDIFKSLVGNDMVTTCRKSENYFHFENTALFVFACNELPPIAQNQQVDDAFFSRLKILNFMNAIPRTEWIDTLETKLYKEREYIVIRALKGFKRLKSNKYCFTNEKEMDDLLFSYKVETNSFLAFAEKHIQKNRKSKVASSLIDKYYNKYCDINDLPALYCSNWAKTLFTKYGVQKTNITDNSVKYNSRGYVGIELMHLDELEDTDDNTTEWDEELDSKEGLEASEFDTYKIRQIRTS